jgi:hypothetical protein
MKDSSKHSLEPATPGGVSEDDERSRSRTMSRKEMARDLRRQRLAGGPDPEELKLMEQIERLRPKTRADCVNGPRPCLFVSCKHHLYLDVNPNTGSVKLNFPDKEIWELPHTCALDVADQGGITLEEVGDIMNLTRERVRQVEALGLSKLRAATDGEDGDGPLGE